MRVGAQYDDAHPALKIPRHVGQRFAFTKWRLCLIDEDRIAAQRVDRRLEREARTQRCLLEEHHHLLRVERVPKVAGLCLDGVRKLHDRGHLADGQVSYGAEIASLQPLCLFVKCRVGLNAERDR